jgi:HEAT repeat protein
LTVSPPELKQRLAPLLNDPDSRVSTRAASALLKADCEVDVAKPFLRRTAVFGELSAREHAITAMGEWGDKEAFDFLTNELKDRELPVPIRRVILTSITGINSAQSLPYLIQALGHEDTSIQEAAADLIGGMGEAAIEPVLVALRNPTQEQGALLALQNLPLPPAEPIEEYARASVSRAVEYHGLLSGIRSSARNDAVLLLEESLQRKSGEFGLRSLQAIGLLGDRDAMSLAIENLGTSDPVLRAYVIETLEVINARWRGIVGPLTRLWDDESAPDGSVNWPRLLADEDGWIRDCALFAAHTLGEMKMENIATLSLMERILFFKQVPLFADLSPTDLKQLAAIAQEESFSDGVMIAQEGEPGDVMFIIMSGEVRVIAERDGTNVELAVRKAGEYVGEMALISKEPRIASLLAVGDVRTLCIDRKSFESLLRDRPDVSLAVIQVLCQRLKEASGGVYR